MASVRSAHNNEDGGDKPVGGAAVRQAAEVGSPLRAGAQVSDPACLSVCAHEPRVPRVFEGQTSETGEQFRGCFPRVGSQSLRRDGVQGQSQGQAAGADAQGTVRPRLSFRMLESPRMLSVWGNSEGDSKMCTFVLAE